MCSICFQPLETNNIVRTISRCNHIFHRECIDQWFEDNITCPICRYDIRTDIEPIPTNQNNTDASGNTVHTDVSIERVTIPLNNLPQNIIFTKCDKIGPSLIKKNIDSFFVELSNYWSRTPNYFTSSSDKNLGKDEIEKHISRINKSLN